MTKCPDCGKIMVQGTKTKTVIVAGKKLQVENFPVEVCECGFIAHDLFLGAAVETALDKVGINEGVVDFKSLKVDREAEEKEFYKGTGQA